VAVCNGGLPGERVLASRLADLADVVEREELRPPAVLVIGQVAAFATDAVTR